MAKILGLDLGTNSIGIAVRNTDNGNNIEDQLEYFRSVIFKSGVGTGKSGEFSYAAERTKYRSSRSRYKARKQRLWATLRVLIENGFCPLTIEGLNKWSRYDKAKGYNREYPIDEPAFEQWVRLDFNMDGKPDYANPFEIRDELTRRKFNFNDIIDRYIFGRAIYHIAQHRGFKSSKGETLKEQNANESTDEETPQKKTTKGNQNLEDNESEYNTIDALKKSEEQKSKAITTYMTDNNLQTVGQAYCMLIRSGVRVRESEYTAVRSQFKDELKYIFKFQGLDLDSAFCKAILSEKKNEGTIFYKRPLRSQKGLVGKCTLEKGKPRCPISHPEYEYYRAFCFINNIKYRQSTEDEWATLTTEQKSDIFSNVFASKKRNTFKFEKIRGWIEQTILKHSVVLQYVKGGNGTINYPDNTSVSGCPIYARLKDLLGDDWQTREIVTSHERLNKKTGELYRVKYNYEDIWHLCFMFSTSDEYERLEEVAKNTLKFSDDEISKLKGIFNKIEQGYANLSLKAIRKINVYLTKGYIYSHAALLAKLPDIFGEKWQDVSTDIGEYIAELTSEYALLHTSHNITRHLISKYKQLPIEQRFAYKNYSYTLDKSDYDDIEKAIYSVVKKSEFLKKSEEYQEAIRRKVAELYQDFFHSYSRAYLQSPSLIDFISKRIATRYDIEAEVLQKKLYHPSMIEFYPASKDGLLGSPVIGAIRNPMAMRVLHTLRKQINQLIKKGIINSDTRVVVETARELNDANWRWAIKTYQTRRNEENEEFAKILSEYYPSKRINDKDIDSARILIDQSKDFVNSDAYYKKKEDFTKLLKKYRLWLEQGCISIYTGNPIKIADLLNGDYDIEHTVPRSISFDDSLANKTICEADFNRHLKKNLYPTKLKGVSYKGIPDVYKVIEENIKPWQERVKTLEGSIEYYRTQSKHCQDKEMKDKFIQQRHLRELELDYWKKKVNSFTLEEFTDSFRNNQLNDTRIITKYAFHYLKSVFEYVSVQRGETTAKFRKIIGIQSADEKKDRSLHSHHAIDAAVLTLIPSSANKKALLDLFYLKEEAEFAHANTQQYEKDLNDKIEECEIPNTRNLVEFIQNNILADYIVKDQTFTPANKRIRKRGKVVTYKKGDDDIVKFARGDCFRGALHQDSYYGIIKLPKQDNNGKPLKDDNNKYIYDSDCKYAVIRVPITSFKKFKALDDIVDPNVRQCIKDAVNIRMSNGASFEKAIKEPIYITNHRSHTGLSTYPIRHVRCKARAGRGYLKAGTLAKLKQQAYHSTKKLLHLSDRQHKASFFVKNESNYVCFVFESIIKGKIERKIKILSNLDIVKFGYKSFDEIKKDAPNFAPNERPNDNYQLRAVLRTGQKVLIWQKSPDELNEANISLINKRLYIVYKFNKTSVEHIYLRHHLEARSGSDLPDDETSINVSSIQPMLMLSANNFNCLIEGIDFEFDDNEIKFLDR